MIDRLLKWKPGPEHGIIPLDERFERTLAMLSHLQTVCARDHHPEALQWLQIASNFVQTAQHQVRIDEVGND